jgi:hypothetical protein
MAALRFSPADPTTGGGARARENRASEGLLSDDTVMCDDAPLSDEELTALALAADPSAPIAPEAVAYAPLSGVSALPGWYMPAAVIRSSARWHRPLIYAVIAAFLIVDAFGLCSTYG